MIVNKTLKTSLNYQIILTYLETGLKSTLAGSIYFSKLNNCNTTIMFESHELEAKKSLARSKNYLYQF